MATSFAPGLRPSFGLTPNLSSPAGTGVSAAGSVLEIAIAAAAPEGLGPLAPLWKLLYGFIKRKANFDITSITRKMLMAFGAALSIRFAWGYVKPLFLEHLTSSITLTVEHKTARGIQTWLDAQGASRSNRHLKYTVSSVEWNTSTQTHDFVGDKRTAMTGGLLYFKKHPLYFSFQTPKTKEEEDGQMVRSERDKYGVSDYIELSGERITVYSLDPSGSLLQRFADYVFTEEVKESRVTPFFTVSQASNPRGLQVWNQRIKPVRPLSTIDLDEQVKADLVSDVDRFFSKGRARWYSARGIPFKRGILLQGPPGTGKSSISLALAGHIGGSLYTIAIGEVRNEGHLMELFLSARHGSVVLLEDIDSAGIGREKVLKHSTDSSDASDSGNKKPNSGSELTGHDAFAPMMQSARPAHAIAPAGSISLSGLLNAIDALADGVVLIMTTNEPENIDKALVRPGRIDKQIHVGNASRAVAENIFKRFYSDISNEQDVSDAHVRIAELAAEFAGVLIPLSDTPEKAIEDADKWVADLLAAKTAGKNVVGQVETMDASDSDSDTFYDSFEGTDNE
ncbi:hypothetical protein PMIN03_008069 [Paraphaeosphaeria minitans]